jgi:hypothetical protein
MRDADMSVSTGQSVGDVRPRFISARRIASDEELELRAGGLAVKLGREQAASITAPLRARGTVAPGMDARNSRRTWWDGGRAQPRTGLGVFDGRGRQYLPGRGGDGEAVETSQVGVGDQPGHAVALLELDRR